MYPVALSACLVCRSCRCSMPVYMYVCQYVCLEVRCVVRPCVSIFAPLRRSVPAGCVVRPCVSMCAPRAVRSRVKGPKKIQFGNRKLPTPVYIQNAERTAADSQSLRSYFTGVAMTSLMRPHTWCNFSNSIIKSLCCFVLM
jgi:hypothetical protein